jgi:hypothetical protein
MDDAIQEIVVDLHMNDILSYRRIIEICTIRAPIDTVAPPLLSLLPERNRLGGKRYAKIHNKTIYSGEYIEKHATANADKRIA